MGRAEASGRDWVWRQQAAERIVGAEGTRMFQAPLARLPRALGNDEVLGRLDPLAASVDFGEVLDGAKNAFGSGVHPFGAFDGTSQVRNASCRREWEKD